MENIGIILTPALTILLVGLIVPLIFSARKKAEQEAINDKCVCYPRLSVKVLWGTVVFAILLTLTALVCTILSIINPEMMGVSSDDTAGIIIACVLSIALDIFTISASIIFMRKLTYNSDSFTDMKFGRKKKEYFYTDITKIESNVRAIPTYTNYGIYDGRKGKLKIYFGNNYVKIPAIMVGIIEFIAHLQTQRSDLFIN